MPKEERDMFIKVMHSVGQFDFNKWVSDIDITKDDPFEIQDKEKKKGWIFD